MGTVRSLTALTKALTAYACLQLATRKRYADAGKQNKVYVCGALFFRPQPAKVILTCPSRSRATPPDSLFDCTVVGQLNEDSSGRIDVEHQTSSPSPRDAGGDSHPDHPHHPWASPPGSRAPTYEPSYLLTDVRSALEHQQSQQSSAAPPGASPDGPGAVPEPVSQDTEDEALVRQLEELVGNDPEEYVEGGERRRRWVEHGEHEAYYEITEQVTEQVTETQTVEHYKAEDYQRLRQAGLKPPLAAAIADDDEWVEVENGLAPQPDDAGVDLHDGHRSTSSSHIRLVALESSPNGQPAPAMTTVASRAYNDAMDNPQESSARVQVILKTITRRLLQKKRTVKRVRGHSPGLPPPVPRNTLRQAGPGESAPGLMDIDWSAAQDEPEAQNGRAAQDELREVEDMISCPTSDADVPVTPSAIIGPAGEQLYPDVADDPAMRRRASSSSDSPPPVPVRLSSAPLVTPKKPKRQGSSLSSNSSPSSTPPPMTSLSRALVRAKGKFQPRPAKATDAASPSGSACAFRALADASPSLSAAVLTTTPAVCPAPDPSSSDVTMSSRSPSRPPSRPVASKPLAPPKSSVLFPPRPPAKHRQRSPPPAPSSNAPRDRRTRHESVTSTRTQESHSQYHSSAQAPPSDEASPAALFPRDHLVKNIHKFCRFSSAAYGQNFLRVLGLGSTDFMFPSGGRYHPNTWAFAQHTNLPIECMLLSSYVDPGPALSHEKLNPLVHYIAVDHAAQAIVLCVPSIPRRRCALR